MVYNLLNGKILSNENKNTSSSFKINDDQVKVVFLDTEKNIWLGTQLGGINVSFAKTIKFPDNEDDRQHQFENIYSFLETQTGERIVGGEKTLAFFNKNKELKHHSKILGVNTALCIYQENENVFLDWYLGHWIN